MNDKDLIFQALNTFSKNLVNDLLGINTIGTDTLISYMISNLKDKYEIYLEAFTDKNGNININVLCEALRDVIKARNGFVTNVFGKTIKFGKSDIDLFELIFKKLKENNGSKN